MLLYVKVIPCMCVARPGLVLLCIEFTLCVAIGHIEYLPPHVIAHPRAVADTGFLKGGNEEEVPDPLPNHYDQAASGKIFHKLQKSRS